MTSDFESKARELLIDGLNAPMAFESVIAVLVQLHDAGTKVARIEELEHIATDKKGKNIWFQDVYDLEGKTVYKRLAELSAQSEEEDV